MSDFDGLGLLPSLFFLGYMVQNAYYTTLALLNIIQCLMLVNANLQISDEYKYGVLSFALLKLLNLKNEHEKAH